MESVHIQQIWQYLENMTGLENCWNWLFCIHGVAQTEVHIMGQDVLEGSLEHLPPVCKTGKTRNGIGLMNMYTEEKEGYSPYRIMMKFLNDLIEWHWRLSSVISSHNLGFYEKEQFSEWRRRWPGCIIESEAENSIGMTWCLMNTALL